MPRQAHGRPLQAAAPLRSHKRKQARKNTLSALETAEAQNLDEYKIRSHRLGEIEDDSNDDDARDIADERLTKRRKVAVDSNNHETVEDEGSDLEGGRWHEGVNEEDDDSDIDSDAAFGDSDEERFADFTFRGSEKSRSRSERKSTSHAKKQASLNNDNGWEDADTFNNESADGEEEDEVSSYDEDEDLGEEAVDLATALDMNEREEKEEEAERAIKKKRSKQVRQRQTNNDSEESFDESDEDEGQSELSISDDDAQGDTSGLQKFVAGLMPANEQKSSRKSEQKALPDKPSTFGLGSAKLSAADLLRYIKDPAQRQSLKILQSSERQGPEEYKGGIPGKLAAPLAKRQQDRLDRAAAYEKSKETLNRWIDTVKQNRRAEHLSFPLPDPAMQSATSTRQLAPTTQSAPVTSLEATIQDILQDSGLGTVKGTNIEDQEEAYEELQEKNIPIEQVRARRAELRKTRELMFREEIRAKRIKKIKSKAYRRVHRKERDRREAESHDRLAASGLVNSDEEKEKSERRRAEERMGARHRESKWAKGVKIAGRAAWDEDARAGVTDLARRDEELRRRIEGKTVVDSDASQTESDSDVSDTDAEDERFVEKIQALQASEPGPKSRLTSMAFMQRAEAAKIAENNEELRQLRLAIGDEVDESVNSDDETNNFGRQVFGVNDRQQKSVQSVPPIKKNEFEAPLSEDEEQSEENNATQVRPVAGKLLEAAPESSRTTRGQAVSLTDTRRQNGSKPKAPSRPPKESVSNSGKVEPNTYNLAVGSQQAIQLLDDYTSPSESEDNGLPPDSRDDQDILAASIFAGSNDAVKEFAKEKKETVKEEGDQVTDNTLPGWGSWTGTGVSQREQKKGKGRFLTTVKGVAPEKRRDAKLDRVIVNEKRIKKNSKYLATELPHPFETRQQYERSLRLPMGPEWSTANHFQEAIKPRVLLKQGNVIRPIAKPIA